MSSDALGTALVEQIVDGPFLDLPNILSRSPRLVCKRAVHTIKSRSTKPQKTARLALIAGRLEQLNTRACFQCACTQDNACNPPCYWVEDNLCSACVPKGSMVMAKG